ncbi:hypothetical protein VCUG_00685 [Vavraia culicis subsp. floridensis]|uniref:Uncharacterized protein n=1 Tax=Vavraia culicis (isolate floridensis) TaxID=948595 RepID=L2GX30_VAVCU|nr:uncharacterized protein VCUG_00685 [Vavraia culicis subsp. floridensis]ELA47843.1 hypothetical protein VCUG_00685 [Vavraia culicis subsp. floridensis]
MDMYSYRNNGVITAMAIISLFILCFREFFIAVESALIKWYFKTECYFVFDTVALVCFVITTVLRRRVITKDIARGKRMMVELSWFVNIMLVYDSLFILVCPQILGNFHTIHKRILNEKCIWRVPEYLLLMCVRVFNEEIVFRRFLYHMAKRHIKLSKCIEHKKWLCMLAVITMMLLNALVHAFTRVISAPFAQFPYDLIYHVIFNLSLLSISEAYNCMMLTFFASLFNDCWSIVCLKIFPTRFSP